MSIGLTATAPWNLHGQKKVEVDIGDVNKVTHSYTAQYTITALDKLLPKVILCLQEQSGKFGV